MKKLLFATALCALTLAANATTYNYLCAITEIKVDTLASNTKNQFTLNWTQKCKNTAEYTTKPEGTYTTTVKLVLNSDDRTLEGTYTTVGASETSSSANVNDQTINLVTSELYYGSTRRLLRADSVSTFTIIKVDDTHYGISVGRLCFTAANLADRGKNTYNYNYCYAEEEILTQGIEPKPFVFGYEQGAYEQKVSNYDMTVNGISVEHSDTEYGTTRYFLTLSCNGTNRETNKTHEYEVQLAIYPSNADAGIVGSFATRNSGDIMMATNSYVKDLNINKLRYLCNDSLSTIMIASKGENQYSFFGGTLLCVDLDANYSAVYGKKRVQEVHYYHFSDNGGAGIEFGWDENNKETELIPSSVTVNEQIDGFQLLVAAKGGNVNYEVVIELVADQIDGTFTVANEQLSTWTKVSHGTTSSYIANGSTVTINPKSGNKHTLSGSLLCENENTYILKAFDFEYGTATGFGEVQSDKVQGTKVIRDGQLVIMYNGQMYDVQGARINK